MHNNVVQLDSHPANAEATTGEIKDNTEIFEQSPSMMFADVSDSDVDHSMHGATDHSMHEPTDHSMHGATDHSMHEPADHSMHGASGHGMHGEHHDTAQNAEDLPDMVTSLLNQLAEANTRISEAIHASQLATAQSIAADISKTIDKLQAMDVPGNPHIWHMRKSQLGEIKQVSEKVQMMQDFQHGHHLSMDMTKAIESLLTSLEYKPVPDESEAHGMHGGHR